MYKYLPSTTKVQVWMLLWIPVCISPCSCFFKTIHHVLTRVAPHLKERVYMFTGDILGMGKSWQEKMLPKLTHEKPANQNKFPCSKSKGFLPQIDLSDRVDFLMTYLIPLRQCPRYRLVNSAIAVESRTLKKIKAFSNFNSMSWTHERRTMECWTYLARWDDHKWHNCALNIWQVSVSR